MQCNLAVRGQGLPPIPVLPSRCNSFALAHFVVPLRVSAMMSLRQIDRAGHKVTDGCESRFALDIVVNNSEVLEVRVAIAKRAIQSNQGEQLFHVFAHMPFANCPSRFITEGS